MKIWQKMSVKPIIQYQTIDLRNDPEVIKFRERTKAEIQKQACEAYPKETPEIALQKYNFFTSHKVTRLEDDLCWSRFTIFGFMIQRNAADIFNDSEGFWKNYGITITKNFEHLPGQMGYIKEEEDWHKKKMIIQIVLLVMPVIGICYVAYKVFEILEV